MELHQEQMDRIKVESYKDCIWYVSGIDRCKLPGILGERYSECSCKECKLDEFCIWITKFLKSAPKDIDVDNYTSEYLPIINDDGIDEALLVSMLDKVFNSNNA